MPGFSITLLQLPDGSDASAPSADLILSLLDEKPEVPGWKWGSTIPPPALGEQVKQTEGTRAAGAPQAIQLRAEDPKAFGEAVKRACDAIIAAEPEITRMDNIAGDGDCGLTLQDGANGGCGCPNDTAREPDVYLIGVLKALQSGSVSGQDVVGSVIAVSKVAEEKMGGTSGALYSYVPIKPKHRCVETRPTGSSSPRSHRACRRTTRTRTR